MLLAIYAVVVLALPLTLGFLVTLNGLPRTRLCPICAGETLRLRSRRHRLLSRCVPGAELHARWCPSCGWSGTARIGTVSSVPAPARRPALPAPPAPTRSAGLEVRRIELEDGAWRVRLECWAEAETWHGRLHFVAPGGDAWAEGRPLLTGRSAVDVLSQVMSLSERALVGRIRKAIR